MCNLSIFLDGSRSVYATSTASRMLLASWCLIWWLLWGSRCLLGALWLSLGIICGKPGWGSETTGSSSGCSTMRPWRLRGWCSFVPTSSTLRRTTKPFRNPSRSWPKNFKNSNSNAPKSSSAPSATYTSPNDNSGKYNQPSPNSPNKPPSPTRSKTAAPSVTASCLSAHNKPWRVIQRSSSTGACLRTGSTRGTGRSSIQSRVCWCWSASMRSMISVSWSGKSRIRPVPCAGPGFESGVIYLRIYIINLFGWKFFDPFIFSKM